MGDNGSVAGRGKREVYLFVLAIALALASFLFFSVFFDEDVPAFSTEIASAFLGSIITVIITMLLLNRQSAAQKELIEKQAETEQASQFNDKILQAKVDLYNRLLGQVKDFMLREEVSYKDQVEIQMINQQLSYYASEEVLEAFNKFAGLFNAVASDSQVSDEEREQLVGALGKLSLKIRRDLAVDATSRDFDEERIGRLIESNIRSLSPSKIDEETFLDECDEHDRRYFERLFACLKASDVEYTMGTKGFSIKDRRRKSTAGILWCFPTSVNRASVQIFTSRLSGEALETVRGFLAAHGNGINAEKTPPETITFSSAQLPVDLLCDLIAQILRKKLRHP